MVSLGNGDNRAYVYSRDGRDRLLELPATSIEWARELCAISRATVSLLPADCSPAFARINPWAHSLVIYRNKDRVWEGPIRRVPDSPGGLTIAASDVLGWTERRPIRAAITSAGSPVVTELAATIAAAFATDDPNVLAYMQTVGVDTGPSVARDVAAFSGYHDDDLGTLTGLGARFTVIGRRILNWSQATTIGRTPTLVPEKHLLVDVTVTLDGDDLTTEAIARDDSGHAASDTGGDPLVDPFFGHVGMIGSLGGDQAQPTLSTYAANMRAQGYPLPYLVEVPSGAALSCDAPFPVEQLVPGSLVPLETTTATGRKVSATFVLSSVKVTQTGGDDERVSITLAPLTQAAVA